MSLEGLNRAGRRKGQTNLKTRRLKAVEEAAARALIEKMASEDVAKLTAIDVLQKIMHSAYAAGDMQTARDAAIALAPYTFAKLAPVTSAAAVPPELQGDAEADNPPSYPDEPGPAEPVE